MDYLRRGAGLFSGNSSDAPAEDEIAREDPATKNSILGRRRQTDFNGGG